MLTKEQQLALSNKGYDLVFEYKDRPYAIKTESLPSWNEEKKAKFRQETGLDFAFLNEEWVFFNPEQFSFLDEGLRYIGNEEKPDQPINCNNYEGLFAEFRGVSLDLSHWDVSQAICLSYMFNCCYYLQTLNLEGWDVSKCIDFGGMFNGCLQLKSLDIGSWDVSNGEIFSHMFSNCHNLESLDISAWDTSNCITFEGMFANSCNLQRLDINNWNVSKCQNFNIIFEGCTKLKSLGLSKWNVDSEAWRIAMFKDSGLEEQYRKTSDELADSFFGHKAPSTSVENCDLF